MSTIVSQITRVSIVYSTVCSGPDQRKHQKLRVRGLCEGNSPITGEFYSQRASDAEMIPFDDVIMGWVCAVDINSRVSCLTMLCDPKATPNHK